MYSVDCILFSQFKDFRGFLIAAGIHHAGKWKLEFLLILQTFIMHAIGKLEKIGTEVVRKGYIIATL